jgi:F-type H+-transporting ATPase subunit gamma
VPALIDLRRRIKSVRNTQQITQAMKTVATAKFKKAQRTAQFFKRLDYRIDLSLIDRVQKLEEQEIRELARGLMREYVLNRTDAVYVAYNEFKSILAPRVTITPLLPLDPPAEASDGSEVHDWEPGAGSFLHTLLPLYFEDQVCHYVYESIAAEHAARMMAMDNATNNAGELIDDLTLVLNKIRQASITKELLEIMSAVEALSKNR